jgi:hypothetical protein
MVAAAVVEKCAAAPAANNSGGRGVVAPQGDLEEGGTRGQRAGPIACKGVLFSWSKGDLVKGAKASHTQGGASVRAAVFMCCWCITQHAMHHAGPGIDPRAVCRWGVRFDGARAQARAPRLPVDAVRGAARGRWRWRWQGRRGMV